MKNFTRENTLLSQCGLNCGLCPMRINAHCPGCGGGEGHQPCKIARCGRDVTHVQYCFQCKNYPCAHYDGATDYDSVITRQNLFANFERVQAIGIEAYNAEISEKIENLKHLLIHYNDYGKKTLYSVAVNLLSLDDVRAVMAEMAIGVTGDTDLSERASIAAGLFRAMADKRSISLKMKKPSKKAKP